MSLSAERVAVAAGAAHNVRATLSLSVLVPVYNERHLVEASLRRLLALEDPMISELQVVAVNDGSGDGSGAILDALRGEDPRLTVVHHESEPWQGRRDSYRARSMPPATSPSSMTPTSSTTRATSRR